jgi:membrane-associated PAP2 superfamily phosphatase
MGPGTGLPQPRTVTARRRDLLITGIALGLLLAWDASGLDLMLVRRYGSAEGFAWREHWFTGNLLHNGGRWLGLAVLAGLVLNIRWPWFSGLSRGERWRWLLVTLASALLVPLIKQFSSTSCPWDLAEFGGAARYVSHWHFSVADGGAGHCFPSGHAVSAVAFFSGWFALRHHHPKAARRWLAAVCVLGLAFGWAQMARGAHYASHTLWSAWLCWTLAMLAAPPPPAAAVGVPATAGPGR